MERGFCAHAAQQQVEKLVARHGEYRLEAVDDGDGDGDDGDGEE